MTADNREDELLSAAWAAMRDLDGPAALDALGWWELLPHLADTEARAGLFATFRAQGRALASTSALSTLIAQPYLERTAMAPGAAVAAIERTTPRRGSVWTVVGDVRDRHVLFDAPGGARLFEPGALEFISVDVPGRYEVHEAIPDLTITPFLDAETTAAARARSLRIGRIAAANEMLGAAEVAVQLAVDHARDREQFGQPIGTFQAVRHLLAWAKTDVIAVEASLRTALDTIDDPPDQFDAAVKALAGRNGRRACERSLQVLGAIGFTAEHQHHHHHSRVLLLDALLGSSAELTRELGAWLRSGVEPGFARAVLMSARH